MRITESRLRYVIRNMILEGGNYAKYMIKNIDSRILSQIEKMIKNQICMYVEDRGNYLFISLYKVDYREFSKYRKQLDWIEYKSERNELQKEPEAQELVGRVVFVKYGQLNACNLGDRSGGDPMGIKIGGSKRKKVWYVIDAEVVDSHRSLGLGPIMYEAGIEYISRYKNCAVMSDLSVSNFAYNVWKNFNDREDFEKYQFDIDVNTSQGTKILDSDIDQVTPEDTSDDAAFSLDVLWHHSDAGNVDEFRNSWSESPLTKGFFNNQGRVIKELFKQKLIFKI